MATLRIGERLRAAKPGKILLELLIVFVGVYAAFMLNNYQAERQAVRDRGHVIELLRVGLDRYEQLFGGFVQRHENINPQFRAALDRSELPEFGDAFYPAPQYPIEMIDHLVTEQSYGVFSVDVYVPLISFQNALRRLMYVEEKLVQLSAASEPLPPADHADRAWAQARQKQRAERYYAYLEIRKRTSQELVERAKSIGAQLDALAR